MSKTPKLDRQTAETLAGIRIDHVYRYMHAKDLAKGPVLDAACGIGYGSWILAEHDLDVVAVDIEREAIEYGRRFYAHGNIEWIISDLTERPWGSRKFKTIVSFETLEHLQDPEKALKLFHESLEDDGKLICSVPNEQFYPFAEYNGEGETYPHRRHYTPAEFQELLFNAGFTIIHRGTQLNKKGPIVNGSGGKFLIYTAIKDDGR
jgi:2-polyprenyl-3-methyl-5-hydroxy-6-metoxy-1,4-benzoquinol methylase